MNAAAVSATRADKVLENDRRIRSALMDTIAERGWSSVTFTGVAKRAGFTVGALYARAETPSELANDLWTDEIHGFFVESLDEVLVAVGDGDVERVRRFATGWDARVTSASVLVELLVASLFDDELAEGVGESARAELTARCTPTGPDDAHRAAAATLCISFFLGRALALRSSGPLPPLTDDQVAVLARHAVAPPAVLEPTVRVPLTFLRDPTSPAPAATDLDRCVIEVLGRVGYRKSTVARIARAAGVTKGSLASRFDSRAQFVADAAHRILLTPLEVWEQYRPVVAAEGPLTARARFLAEFLRPEHRDLWRINLELAHAALVVPELAEFATPPETLPHTHLGVMLVACFADGLADLPFAGPFGAGSAT